MVDILSLADNFSSDLELFINLTNAGIEEIKEIYQEKMITKEQYQWAIDYIKENS